MKSPLVFVAALLAAISMQISPTAAAPNGNWKLKTKTKKSWMITGALKNGVLSMDGGSCTTKKSTAEKVTGSCIYQSGYCSRGSKIHIKVKVTNDGALSATASGSCNGGRF